MSITAITQFSGEHRWLSNFAYVEIWHDGRCYPSVEHAYQAAKTESCEERDRIRACRTPAEAKRAGRSVTIDPGWDERKRQVMLALLRRKFEHATYRRWLLATGDAELVEGNTWGDRYWGKCGGEGQNVLGQLIMRVRNELVLDGRSG